VRAGSDHRGALGRVAIGGLAAVLTRNTLPAKEFWSVRGRVAGVPGDQQQRAAVVQRQRAAVAGGGRAGSR